MTYSVKLYEKSQNKNATKDDWMGMAHELYEDLYCVEKYLDKQWIPTTHNWQDLSLVGRIDWYKYGYLPERK